MSAWLASLPVFAAQHGDDDRPSVERGRTRSKPQPVAHRETANETVLPGINRVVLLPDAEIVARIRNGDTALYGRLFEAYWTSLCEVAAFATHAPDDAREIVADVFAAIWERRDRWTVTTTVEAYLFGAVRQRGRRMYRDRTHQRELLSAQFDPDWETTSLDGQRATDTGDLSDITDRRLTLERLVQALPERAQLAIYLRWHRELEYREIGEILGISTEAARKLTTRTLDTLRTRL